MEMQYSLMDVVWARARKPKSEIFWPAQVIENAGSTKRSSKKIIASVRFLGENTEDDVKNPKDIKKWDCEEQNTFIQKGKDSLKDSNAKICFMKGIKEARKLVKEISKSTNGNEVGFLAKDDSFDDSKGEKKNGTPVKFVDDKTVPCANIRTCEVSTTERKCDIQDNIQSPRKRGKKRAAGENRKELNNDMSKATPCKSIHGEENNNCHSSRRKRQRNNSDSDSNKNDCNGDSKGKYTCQKQPDEKLRVSQRRSPRHRLEKGLDTKCESFKEKSQQNKKKRIKDRLSLLFEDLQEEACSLDSPVANTKPEERTKQKGRKQLFPNEPASSCDQEPQGSTVANEHLPNLLSMNEDVIGTKTEDSDSDESSDRELMETVLDTSPSSKNLTFTLSDVVWAKYSRDPYWPAQVIRIQKKPRKVYVKFLGYNDKRSFSCKKLHPFACDVSKRQEFISEGSKKDPVYFQNALTEAEDLVRKKALGISIEPEVDEDFQLVETEEPKQEIQESNVQEIPEQNIQEKEDVRRSKRSKKQMTKYNRDMLSYIREAKPILKEILEEKQPCERHTIFKTGKTKAKHALKKKSGFGPISDSDLEDEIVEILMEFYDEVSLKKEDFSRSIYVMDVWLPEAIIYAIQKIDHIDRKKAELIFNKGTSESFNFAHCELYEQLKNKPLSDEDRQTAIARAERYFQMQK